mgnify:CR=1 FL=1
MPIIILLILIGIPLLEIAVFIEVGSEIGGSPTLLLTIGTAIMGLSIVRLQGMRVMAQMKETITKDTPPVEGLVHGFFLFFAGLFLLIPGFITDSIGVFLLIPPIRLFLGRAGLATVILNNPKPPQNKDPEGNVIIEGQYEKVEDDVKSDKKH